MWDVQKGRDELPVRITSCTKFLSSALYAVEFTTVRVRTPQFVQNVFLCGYVPLQCIYVTSSQHFSDWFAWVCGGGSRSFRCPLFFTCGIMQYAQCSSFLISCIKRILIVLLLLLALFHTEARSRLLTFVRKNGTAEIFPEERTGPTFGAGDLPGHLDPPLPWPGPPRRQYPAPTDHSCPSCLTAKWNTTTSSTRTWQSVWKTFVAL